MRWFTRFALVLLIALATPARAGSIALVLSENGGMYTEFANILDESLSGTTWNIVSTSQGDAPPQPARAPDLQVTVGSEALRRTLSRGESTPIIATLLPRQSYEKILAEHRRTSGRITAIYLDQPANRQATFLRYLLPDQKRFGVLFSSETKNSASQYRQAFAWAGLVLDSEDSDTDKTLLPALNALLTRSGALVALPDSSIYHRNNIKAILITAFRHQRPVIGYSTAFVTAGALAALHSTPSQIARQTAEMIATHGTNLAPPTGPTQFAIAINQNVAQALGLNIPDEASLRRSILADRDAR
jgi:ABC-type uncharacterized transport system substrate-binding protein